MILIIVAILNSDFVKQTNLETILGQKTYCISSSSFFFSDSSIYNQRDKRISNTATSAVLHVGDKVVILTHLMIKKEYVTSLLSLWRRNLWRISTLLSYLLDFENWDLVKYRMSHKNLEYVEYAEGYESEHGSHVRRYIFCSSDLTLVGDLCRTNKFSLYNILWWHSRTFQLEGQRAERKGSFLRHLIIVL